MSCAESWHQAASSVYLYTRSRTGRMAQLKAWNQQLVWESQANEVPFSFASEAWTPATRSFWKEMSTYSIWFYSVRLGQYYQELRGLLVSQASNPFSAPSSVLLQLNYFSHLFKEYLVNHNQIFGLCSLRFPPSFPFSILTASIPGLLYHLVSLMMKSGSLCFLQK